MRMQCVILDLICRREKTKGRLPDKLISGGRPFLSIECDHILAVLGRDAIFFLKCSVEAGIITESEHLIGLGDILPALYGFPAGAQAFLGDILVDGKSQIILKHMRDMIFADIELPGQDIQREIFIQMILNILDDILIK